MSKLDWFKLWLFEQRRGFVSRFSLYDLKKVSPKLIFFRQI